MNNQGVKYTILLILLSISSITNAAIFDFKALGNANERGYVTFVHTVDGIQLSASGSSPDGSIPYNAYLDSGNAGLGVCQNLTSSYQCTPSSDDNVTYLENLILTFDQEVNIEQTTFVNGSHGTNFLGSFDMTIDGGTTTTYSLTNIFSTILTGTEFIFTNMNPEGGSYNSNEYQFYISALNVTPAAVPVPAAVWLLGSGLLGLISIARRR